MAKIINTTEFQKEIVEDGGVVLLDFFAEWCGPCKMIAPVLEELSSELDGKARILKTDVDSNPELADKFGIQSIPTMIIFKDGKEVDKLVGFLPKPSLKAKIEQYI